MKRAAAVVAWLATGHLVLGAFYWALLQVPESNVFMLTSSLLLVVTMVLWTGFIEGTALLAWSAMSAVRPPLTTALRRAWLVVVPLALVALVWWLTGLADSWFVGHAGEIDAWLLVKTGWTHTSGLHGTITWLLVFLKYGVGASAALALFAALVRKGLAGLASLAWLRQAFGWRQLAGIAISLFAGVALPWRLAYWRPASLSATWVEPAFAGVKLFAMFIVMNVAWSLVLWIVARQASTGRPPPAVSGEVALAA